MWLFYISWGVYSWERERLRYLELCNNNKWKTSHKQCARVSSRGRSRTSPPFPSRSRGRAKAFHTCDVKPEQRRAERIYMSVYIPTLHICMYRAPQGTKLINKNKKKERNLRLKIDKFKDFEMKNPTTRDNTNGTRMWMGDVVARSMWVWTCLWTCCSLYWLQALDVSVRYNLTNCSLTHGVYVLLRTQPAIWPGCKSVCVWESSI